MTVARYVGLANESEFNQGSPPEAQVHVDIASATLDAPGDTQMFYGGGLQRSARLHRPGFYAPTGNIVYAFDIKTIGFLLAWALGGYSFKDDGGEASGHHKHQFYGSPLNILPSFVARVGKDHFEHVFSGCVINSLEIQVEDEFTMATADITAAKDRKATLKSIQDLLLPEEYPLAFYEVTAFKEYEGEDEDEISAKVKSITITIDNNQDAEAGRGLGSRHPYRIIAGERETTISKPLFYEGSGPLAELWGEDSGVSATGPSPFQLRLEFDSGEHGNMEIKFPNTIYTQVQQQPSGRDEIVQETEARAVLGTTMELHNGAEVDTEVFVNLENEHAQYLDDFPGALSGVVTDDNDPEVKLEGVTVSVEDEDLSATTDSEGKYMIPQVPAGTYTIKAEKEGWETATEEEVEIESAKTKQVNFSLVEETEE